MCDVVREMLLLTYTYLASVVVDDISAIVPLAHAVHAAVVVVVVVVVVMRMYSSHQDLYGQQVGEWEDNCVAVGNRRHLPLCQQDPRVIKNAAAVKYASAAEVLLPPMLDAVVVVVDVVVVVVQPALRTACWLVLCCPLPELVCLCWLACHS